MVHSFEFMFKVNRKGVVTTETGSLKQTYINIVAFSLPNQFQRNVAMSYSIVILDQPVL